MTLVRASVPEPRWIPDERPHDHANHERHAADHPDVLLHCELPFCFGYAQFRPDTRGSSMASQALSSWLAWLSLETNYRAWR